MPYATNPIDGVRTYFEEWAGEGSPILVYTGLGDPLEDAQRFPLVKILAEEHRIIFADHRGQGRSDKPHEERAYALETRVPDAVAVLDELQLASAHVLGFSWGARLGFAMGEFAPKRVRSLVLCGNQPYAWNPEWSFVRMLNDAVNATLDRGMQGFMDVLEKSFGVELGEPSRGWVLANDPLALRAAWSSALSEGAISLDLSSWRIPTLIYMSTGDEMYADARRASEQIPSARFISLAGHSHLSAPFEVEQVLPDVRALVEGS